MKKESNSFINRSLPWLIPIFIYWLKGWSDKAIAIGAVIASIITVEELVRYIFLKKEKKFIILMIQVLFLNISMMGLYLIKAFYTQYSKYSVFFGVLGSISFFTLYVYLLVNLAKQGREGKRFIIIVNGIMIVIIVLLMISFMI